MRRAHALGRDLDNKGAPNMALPPACTTLFLLRGQNRKPRLMPVSGFKERWQYREAGVSS
jgi:hypothetical protein